MRINVVALSMLFAFASLAESSYVIVPDDGARANFLKEVEEGKLSTPPLCYLTSSHDSSWYKKVSEMNEYEFFEYLYNVSKSAITVDYRITGILHLVSVNEKEKTVDVIMTMSKTWEDCRIISNNSEYKSIYIKASHFHQLDVFQPHVSTKEALTPTLDDANLDEDVIIANDGSILMTYKFPVSLSCNINVEMYPFDVHVCNITFSTSYYASHFIVGSNSTRFCSEWLMHEYVPNDQWAFVILAPRRILLGWQYRIVLRRQTFEHLAETIAPLFFMVLACSIVYWMPVSNGSRTGLNLAVVLSLFLFYELTFERIPKSNRGSLLGRYFQACFGLAVASSLYSIISSLTFSTVRQLQFQLPYFLSCLAPCLLAGVTVPADANASANVQFSNSSSNVHQMSGDGDSDALLKSTSDCKVQVQVQASNQAESNRASTSAANTWTYTSLSSEPTPVLSNAALAVLLDRLFSIVLFLCNLILLCSYVMKGYVAWNGYGAIRNWLTEADMQVICRQLALQGADYGDLPCDSHLPEELYNEYLGDLCEIE